MFDECLREAKIYAEFNSMPTEKPKKVRGKKSVRNFALF